MLGVNTSPFLTVKTTERDKREKGMKGGGRDTLSEKCVCACARACICVSLCV